MCSSMQPSVRQCTTLLILSWTVFMRTHFPNFKSREGKKEVDVHRLMKV